MEQSKFQTVLLSGIVLTALMLGCRPADVQHDSGFDVLIYVLDACRADRIGAYGYQRPTSPTIDSLAADPDAVVYTRHYVAGNWTKPVTASLFTGKYVYQHGITNLQSEVAESRYRAEVLADEFVTLAERFRDAGYATYGLVTSPHLAPAYGFAQGFDEYFDPETLKVGDLGRNARLIDLIESRGSSPYFAYVHQNACHNPFRPEDRDPEFMAEFGFDYDEKAREKASIDFTTSKINHAISNGEIQLTAEDTRFLSLIYDAKLRKVDREVVSSMIAGLRSLERWDRTLFILTADHGEELYEHRGYTHGHALWEEVIHVPLIVKFPAGMRPPNLPKRVDALTTVVDLYPTLLELLGQPIPDGLLGRSIFDSLKGGLIFSQGEENWAVIRGKEKLIVEGDGRKLLFDLETDPKESRDLAAARPERLRDLVALVEAARVDAFGAPETETELSPEVIERLRSLGYLN